MVIGKLNRRIAIQSYTSVVDGAGGVSQMATGTPFECWASVVPLSSNYLVLQGMQALNNAYTITARYYAGTAYQIDTTKTISYEGKTLVVVSYKQISEGRKRFWEIIARENTTGGLESSSDSGDDNHYPGGGYKWDKGDIVEVNPYTLSYSVTYASLPNNDVLVYAAQGSIIDWGDGVLYQYPNDVTAEKFYPTTDGATITVYHDNTQDRVFVTTQGGTSYASSITGDIPESIVFFNVSDHMPTIPVLPVTVRVIEISGSHVLAAELDTIADRLYQNGIQGGRYSLLTADENGVKQYATLSKLDALRGRSWDIIEWRGIPGYEMP